MISRWLPWSLIVVTVLVTISPTQCASQLVTAEAVVDVSEILIGDVIRYSLMIKAPEDVTLFLPQAGINLDRFEIRDYYEHSPAVEDGLIVYRIDYDISIYEIGEFDIPELTVEYRDAQGREGAVTCNRLPIVVRSMNPDQDAEIRELKEVQLPVRSWGWLLRWLLILVLVSAVGILLTVLYRRRRSESRPSAPLRPEHEVALEALDALAAENLPARGEIKPYYIALTGIMKQYLGRRFGFLSMESTSEEVIRVMGDLLDEHPMQRLHSLLTTADLVKFARHRPVDEVQNDNLERARTLVDETRRREGAQ